MKQAIEFWLAKTLVEIGFYLAVLLGLLVLGVILTRQQRRKEKEDQSGDAISK
jgi:uncharacterized membrane protein YiaA